MSLTPGPLPKPTELKRREGNPGKRPLNENEPNFSTLGEVQPPEHLDEVARKEWERIAPELRANGLLTHADRALLAAYCQSYSSWVQLSKELEEHGRTIVTPNGLVQTSPLVTQCRQEREAMAKFASHFGFSPATRTRIEAPKPANKDDELLI